MEEPVSSQPLRPSWLLLLVLSHFKGMQEFNRKTLSWEWVHLGYRACVLLSGGLALGKWLNLSDPQYLRL